MIEWCRRYPEVHVNPSTGIMLENDPSILGQAFLCDIEVGHDLEPRHQSSRDFCWNRQLLLQDAVDTDPNTRLFLERINMYV